MDVEQRIHKLETLVTLLVEYINQYNIGSVTNLELVALRRCEALHRHRINYELDHNNNVGVGVGGGGGEGEDEIDGSAVTF